MKLTTAGKNNPDMPEWKRYGFSSKQAFEEAKLEAEFDQAQDDYNQARGEANEKAKDILINAG